ncbi:LD-carboxypeptidase [Sesbania bispinosa]|nr:LD-carboxypeptidase [Sesbania bispinosa]
MDKDDGPDNDSTVARPTRLLRKLGPLRAQPGIMGMRGLIIGRGQLESKALKERKTGQEML